MVNIFRISRLCFFTKNFIIADVIGVAANNINRPKISAVVEIIKTIFQFEKPNTFNERRSLFD